MLSIQKINMNESVETNGGTPSVYPSVIPTVSVIEATPPNNQTSNISTTSAPNLNGTPTNTNATPGGGTGLTSSLKSSNVIENQPKRRVSIAADPAAESRFNGAYDNPAFEQNPRRKISQTSMHSHTDIGPARRKSILVNGGHDNESDHSSTHSFDNRPSYRPSALDQLHAKYNQQQQQQQQQQQSSSYNSNSLEDSWLYSFCLKCRGEENVPSWEPPHWQKVCPYPLCPSFRQFSRICVLILIGVLIWITAFVIIGETAAPGGQLFSLVVLSVLLISVVILYR